MISDPLALILLVRNYESMHIYVSAPLKMLSPSKYNFWEQNQWWGDSYYSGTLLISISSLSKIK